MPARRRARAATTAASQQASTATAPTTAPTTAATAADDLSRADIDAVNRAELHANAQEVITTIHMERPLNTNNSYKPKQREFNEFCAAKQYHDGNTVTEEKLLLFITSQVANRPLRIKSRTADKSIPRAQTCLKWRSVRDYVTAVTDLYRSQRALGMNCHPSPREDTVRNYLKTLQRRDAERERKQYIDKGRDTLLDGYSEKEFNRLCHELWAHGTSSTELHFRTLVDFLAGHYFLMRGSERLGIELSDLFTFEFIGEGPTRCMPAIVTTRGSKKNQFGRLETMGALRHRNPQTCLLSALGFYFLWRWDLTDEPFPDFGSRSAWYNIRLIKSKGNDRTAALAYNTQLDWVGKAFQYAGIASHKKTHIGRSSSAKMAELKGISEDQIRRAGRWNHESMVGCYLNALPRQFMRSMAGHPAGMGCFEIRRAAVQPPDELLSQIWPELDCWKGCFGPGEGQINDLAAMGLTDLLLYLREVILQDSIILRKRFPRSPVWDHAVFQNKAYELFAARMQDVVDCSSDGGDEQPSQLAILTQAMPALADFLRMMDARIERVDARNETRFGKLQAAVADQSAAQGTQLMQLLTSGNLTLRVEHVTQEHSQSQTSSGLPRLAPAPLPAGSIPAGVGSSRCTSAQASLAASLAPSRATSPPLGAGAGTAPGAGASQRWEEPPRHCMSRTVKTVEMLWREWTVGLSGGPPIGALDSRWGARWRSGRQSEMQWYSLRLEAIKEIRRTAKAQRISEEQAMWRLHISQQQQGYSLDKLCKQLRASARSGTTAATTATATATA